MGKEFAKLLKKVQKSPAKALILYGLGGVYSAGGDLKVLASFAENSIGKNASLLFDFYSSFLGILDLPIPVISAVEGHAIGAGLSLALASDVRVFSQEGKYAFNFLKLGIHPGMGSSFLAMSRLSPANGQKLLWLAEPIDGMEASKLGLATESLPQKQVYERALILGKKLAFGARSAQSELKKSLAIQHWKDLLKRETQAQSLGFDHPDFRETLHSIQEKRPPHFF